MPELCPTTAAITNLQRDVANVNASISELFREDGTLQMVNRKIAQLAARLDAIEKATPPSSGVDQNHVVESTT